MYKHITIEGDQSADLLRYKIINRARKVILLYKSGFAEKMLDRYLFSKYKTNLKLACLHLLKNVNISKNYNKELIITFDSTKDSKLAHLISYGNREVQGSKILVDAFDYK